ncbi:MAG: hypothetical protein ABIY70_15985 [Capsulimonas sp.]|uniref:DUF6916 family protein n=1 Tax=Capsulimonas sp. TaxID=2494211 RepID=UPI003262E72C
MDDTLSLSQITAASFTPLIGDTFTLPFDDAQTVDVVLSDVRPMRGPEGQREPFALTFLGAPGVVLPQRIYRFTHPETATMDIFIVPLAANAQSTTYEAIFA